MIINTRKYFCQEAKPKEDDVRWVKITDTAFFKALVGLICLNAAAGCIYFEMLTLALSPDKLAGFTMDAEFWVYAVGVAFIDLFGLYCVVLAIVQEIRELRQEHVKLRDLVFGGALITLVSAELIFGLFATPTGFTLMFDTWEEIGFHNIPVNERVAGVILMVTGFLALKHFAWSVGFIGDDKPEEGEEK